MVYSNFKRLNEDVQGYDGNTHRPTWIERFLPLDDYRSDEDPVISAQQRWVTFFYKAWLCGVGHATYELAFATTHSKEFFKAFLNLDNRMRKDETAADACRRVMCNYQRNYRITNGKGMPCCQLFEHMSGYRVRSQEVYVGCRQRSRTVVSKASTGAASKKSSKTQLSTARELFIGDLRRIDIISKHEDADDHSKKHYVSSPLGRRVVARKRKAKKWRRTAPSIFNPRMLTGTELSRVASYLEASSSNLIPALSWMFFLGISLRRNKKLYGPYMTDEGAIKYAVLIHDDEVTGSEIVWVELASDATLIKPLVILNAKDLKLVEQLLARISKNLGLKVTLGRLLNSIRYHMRVANGDSISVDYLNGEIRADLRAAAHYIEVKTESLQRSIDTWCKWLEQHDISGSFVSRRTGARLTRVERTRLHFLPNSRVEINYLRDKIANLQGTWCTPLEEFNSTQLYFYFNISFELGLRPFGAQSYIEYLGNDIVRVRQKASATYTGEFEMSISPFAVGLLLEQTALMKRLRIPDQENLAPRIAIGDCKQFRFRLMDHASFEKELEKHDIKPLTPRNFLRKEAAKTLSNKPGELCRAALQHSTGYRSFSDINSSASVRVVAINSGPNSKRGT